MNTAKQNANLSAIASYVQTVAHRHRRNRIKPDVFATKNLSFCGKFSCNMNFMREFYRTNSYGYLEGRNVYPYI